MSKIKMKIKTLHNVHCDDSKDHLCNYCKFDYPECDPEFLLFGNGIGNDNVTTCSQCRLMSEHTGFPIKFQALVVPIDYVQQFDKNGDSVDTVESLQAKSVKALEAADKRAFFREVGKKLLFWK